MKDIEKEKAFTKLCEDEGLTVETYSGRGMYGRYCPSVNVDSLSEFPGNPHHWCVDSMGLGFVIYTG